MGEKLPFFVPLTLDDRACLTQAAQVLRVAPDGLDSFVDHIGTIVCTASLRNKLSSDLSDVDVHARAAAKAVRSASTAVARLTPRQKRRLGVILTAPFTVPRVRVLQSQERNGGPLISEPYDVMRRESDRINLQFGDDTAPWLDPTMDFETQDNLVELMIEFLDAAFGKFIDRSDHSVPGKPGKPAGAKGQWAMHDFVAQLWIDSYYYGNVTLSNRGGQAGGSIVALLNALRPMLPKAFFPGILNYSFLRKVQKSLPEDLKSVSV
jgi:hypothetical protein